MDLHFFKFVTMQMDQFPASLTFTMKADICVFVTICSNILKASRTVSIYDVLVDNPIIDKTLQLTVNCGLPYIRSLTFEILAHITGGNMNSRNRFKIIKQNFPLFCLVL